MKRKFFSALVVGMAVLGLCACESTNKENVKETGKETQTIVVETENKETETQETEAEESKAQEGAAIESEIRRLVDENLYCMRDVFVLSMLPTEDTPIEGEWIYPVKEDVFKDYAEFDAYVRSVYCKETADMYLCGEDPKYVNIDGKLCANKYLEGSKGYYVDWTDYDLTIDSVTEDECTFTVTCSVEWPADKPVKEAYPVSGKAVKEDGKWLLTSMLY